MDHRRVETTKSNDIGSLFLVFRPRPLAALLGDSLSSAVYPCHPPFLLIEYDPPHFHGTTCFVGFIRVFSIWLEDNVLYPNHNKSDIPQEPD